MWTEATLLDAVIASCEGSDQPVHMLRQVEVEDRRIDAMLIVGGKRIGVEAKVTMADYRNETEAKRAPTWRATNGCVYLCPPRVIEASEVPDGWGLWWAVGPASIRVVREPVWRSPHPGAADGLATSLLRRAAGTERRVRAAERVADPVASLVAVDEQVQRLEGMLANAAAAVAREKARAQDAAEQVAAIVGEQVCAACGHPITYTRVRKWRHESSALDTQCEKARAEEERQRRMTAFAAEYTSIPAPPVIPASVSMDH